MESKLPDLRYRLDVAGHGWELAKRIRRDEVTEDLPLVMLTARTMKALKSFADGVDDCILLPLRTARAKNTELRNKISTLGLPNGEQVHTLYWNYLRNPDRAFERSQLLDRVWGRSVYVEERTVDVLRLRKLLKPYSHRPFRAQCWLPVLAFLDFLAETMYVLRPHQTQILPPYAVLSAVHISGPLYPRTWEVQPRAQGALYQWI